MGRPPKQINWAMVDKYCHIHCTQTEIADLCETDTETLNIRCLQEWGLAFPVYHRVKCAGGKMSLRRAQMRTAEKGNAAIQIWLGKQLLGQIDKAILDTQDPNDFAHRIMEAVRQGNSTVGSGQTKVDDAPPKS